MSTGEPVPVSGEHLSPFVYIDGKRRRTVGSTPASLDYTVSSYNQPEFMKLWSQVGEPRLAQARLAVAKRSK
jgi:hypothetical protein